MPERRGRRRAPRIETVRGGFGCALAVDVEEWYHNCHVPEYVDPRRRPPLPTELDRLLPDLLELLSRAGRSATFFVLGEVAETLPGRVRQIAAGGHEVASHGFLHRRASTRPLGELRADAARSKALLEDVLGSPVRGFRSPEWSLRQPRHPLLPELVALGFDYDSSLAPVAGAGRRSNPRHVARLRWNGGRELLEVPPLTFGGRLQLPAGGWIGRLAPAAWLIAAARRHRERGGLPLITVHPWELAARPTPGEFTGFARLLHETGRAGYAPRFDELLRALPWTSIRAALEAGESSVRSPLDAAL